MTTGRLALALLLSLTAAACGEGNDMSPPKPCAAWPTQITAGVNDKLTVGRVAYGGKAYDATIAAATYYSPASLAAAVAAALDAGAAWGAPWSATVSDTGRITISAAGGASFIVGRTTSYTLTKYSEQLDIGGGLWAPINASVLADQTAAPDGTTTAELLRESAINSGHWLWFPTPTLEENGTYTISICAKPAGRSSIALHARSKEGTYNGARFDLTNGTVSEVVGNATAAAVSLGNGWYRCSVSYPSLAGATAASALVYIASSAAYLGDGASGVYLWGGQIERGAHPGPYTTTGNAILQPASNPLNAVLGFSDDNQPAGASVTSGNQMQGCWYADDPVAEDSFDRPVQILRAQTRALSGKVRTRTFATPYERFIALAFLEPHKAFVSEEGTTHTNEALERLFLSGAERFRWFPDASDAATYADYALDAGTKFDPRRLSPGAALYSQSMRLLRWVG